MSARVLRLLRNRFITGLVILIPIVITANVLWSLFSYVDGHAVPLTRALVGRDIPGAGFVLTLVLVLATGILFASGPLRLILNGLVGILESVPIVGPVYGTIRKVLSGFGSPQARKAFQRFVFVRWAGTLGPGFLTGSFALKEKNGTSVTYRVVYLPTNHLYIGNILVVPDEDVIPTDIPVEDGISCVLSAGSSIPAEVHER